MKKTTALLLLSGLLGPGLAAAHIGIANNTLPISAAGQAAFTVDGATSEIQFLIPHGCNAESVPAPPAPMDTTKIEITVPAALVSATGAASVRPSHSGEFGLVSRVTQDDGSLKFTWNRNTPVSADDDQLYKVSLRLKTPATDTANAPFAIKKYQFPATQTCSNNGATYVMAWGTGSPTLLSFPEKRKGFNRYNLHSSTVGDFTAASGTATLAARLKAYFGDAVILWSGKSGYSANAATAARIDALAVKDKTYSNLGSTQGVSLTVTDTLWVKY